MTEVDAIITVFGTIYLSREFQFYGECSDSVYQVAAAVVKQAAESIVRLLL